MLFRFVSSPAFALALALAFCAGARAQAQPPYAAASYEGADRTERLLAAAKKEGALTLYTSIAEKDVPSVVAPFEKKYGIKVRVWRSGTVNVLQRTVSEAAARRNEVDVIHISAPEMEALHREKLLAPVSSPFYKALIPGAVPAHREWAATLLSVWVQAYNTKAVRKDEVPKTYADLLDPRWKGRLAVEAEDQDWFATVVTEMGEAQGLKFFRDLAERNGVGVRQGHALLNNLVVSGEVPLALTVYNYMPEQAKQKGAPIDWTTLAPVAARSNGIGVALRAPHPAAAVLFHDFMLSDAQDLLASIDYVPASSAAASPFRNMRIRLVDPVLMLDQRDKWTRLYSSIFVRH